MGAFDYDGIDVEPNVDLSYYSSGFSWQNRLARGVWWGIWALLFRPSPRPFFAWRRFLLRMFGAQLGRGTNIHASCKIWAPWNLEMGEFSCLAFHVDCYNVDKVTIGAHSTVSQYSYLCSASHDISDPAMGLVKAPISIGRGCWVAAGVFVGPGVAIENGAVIAARAVVVKSVGANEVVGGNPARVLGTRGLRAE